MCVHAYMHARTYVCLHAHIDVCALVRVCADVGTPVHCIACIAYAYCACIRAKINTWPHHILCACTGTNGRKPQGFTRLTGAAPCPRAGGPEPGRNTSGPPPGRADLGLSTCVSVSAHPPPPPPDMSSPGMNDRGPPPFRADLGVSTCRRRQIVTISLTSSVAISPTINVHASVAIPLSLPISPPISRFAHLTAKATCAHPSFTKAQRLRVCARARTRAYVRAFS